MAKLMIGILGGFSGTVGTVVGCINRNGNAIIRSRSKKPRTSKTDAQVNQRAKFGSVIQFLQPLNPLLKIGLKAAAGTIMSPLNYASMVALNEAVSGSAPDIEIDYTKVLLSEGGLGEVSGASMALTDKTVNFQWEDNSSTGTGEATDNAVMVAYNVDNGQVSYLLEGVTRASQSGSLSIPNSAVGNHLLMYLFFQSASDVTLVSTSQYVGNAVIA
jgi:hypothetical protein